VKSRLSSILGLLLVALTASCGGSDEPASNSLIAFHSDRDGDYDIYTMRPNGKDAQRLTSFTGPDRDPAWSPDGAHIAFWSRCAGLETCSWAGLGALRPWFIVMMNADGSGKTTVERSTQFSWSPDSTRLALTVSPGTGAGPSAGIHVIEAGKPGLTRLTTTRGDMQPAWSPDGRRIAYMSPVRVPPPPGLPDGPSLIDSREIFVMNADGSDARRLVGVDQQASPSPNAPLRWSPDGSKLLYYSVREVCDLVEELGDVGDKPGCIKASSVAETYVVDVATGALTRVSIDTGVAPWPVWSPDGKRIAFTSSREGNDDVYVMNPDGSNVKRLTNHPEGDQWPSWSPDGKRIAFQSYRDGNWEIYVMNADGSKQTNVSRNAAADWEPAWSPRRK
jgi:Tol biopolymer transport system component